MMHGQKNINSLNRLKFKPRPVHVGFMVDTVALGLVFSLSISVIHVQHLSTLIHSSQALYNLSSLQHHSIKHTHTHSIQRCNSVHSTMTLTFSEGCNDSDKV